ncbi:EthD domain-containing protein [Pseudomonas abietaniphila]|uniref:EthD domain-containing protein n=1 Tax=Pseudomonas abietaniphila TaxID=89065 RepID=UPI000783DC75|nr:EthD domain-containing protein [Pseudomonas abietaniphila]
MVKLIFMLKRKAGITPQAFRDHYESSHVKLAQKYIGHLLERYVRNYPVQAVLNPSNQAKATAPVPFTSEYDVITEMYLKDSLAVEEMSRIFNDPDINPILVEDELKFLDRASTLMLVCDQVDTGTV